MVRGLGKKNIQKGVLRPRTTDTQWRHKSNKSENLGRCGRQNMLRPYLKIWEWEWIFGRAVKAISSLGVRSPWSFWLLWAMPKSNSLKGKKLLVKKKINRSTLFNSFYSRSLTKYKVAEKTYSLPPLSLVHIKVLKAIFKTRRNHFWSQVCTCVHLRFHEIFHPLYLLLYC